MPDNALPLKPPHLLANIPDFSTSHCLLLYRGQTTGRWLNVQGTRTGPGSDGRQESRTYTLPQQDANGYGEVTLRLSPEPHMDWLFWHGGVSQDGYPLPALKWPLFVPPTSLSGEFATRAGHDGPPPVSVRPSIAGGTRRLESPIDIGRRSGLLDEVRFYLVNFQICFLIDAVSRNGKADRHAGLKLRAGDWRVEIERREDFMDVLNYVEEHQGYGVTHHGRLWREDGDEARENFTFDDAAPVLKALMLFASFVRGGLVGLALPVGYKDDESAFERWHVTPVDPGRYPHPHRTWPLPGWYPLYLPTGYVNPHPATWLPALFERFAEKFLHVDVETRQFWQSVLCELVYTYTDAERFDKERAIVPACTALETLGWAILVVQDKWLTGDRHPQRGRGGYERLAAADRLRLLLRWAGLATDIPSHLPHLVAKAAEHNGKADSAELIAWTRNRVVHPDKHDQLPDGLSPEAWMVAMWYTELTILRLLGYDGYYRNRLNGEEVERVPWATD